MKKFRSHQKEKTEPAEYWDEHDTSQILETGAVEALKIAKVENRCPNCGSGRIRRRIIDLPVLEGKLVLSKLKVYYCADCKTSVIEEAGLKEFYETLHYVAAKDRKNFREILNEAMAAYEKKWQERVKERKVISIYFPTKEGNPAKAHISIMSSDPLYSQIRSLSSEAIRSLLGLQYYEDLESEASKQQRSISQYLRLALMEKLHLRSDDPSEDKETSHRERTIILFPERIRADQFTRAFSSTRPLELAAQSIAEEVFVCQTKDQKFVGRLDYNYETASLYLEIAKDDFGIRLADAELVMKDNEKVTQQNLRVENNRILLFSETEHTAKDVAQIVLKIRQ